MPLVLPNEGLTELLGWLLKDNGTLPDLVFTLWVNDLTPDQATVYADLVIADFGGFQEQLLTRSGWLTPVLDGDEAVTTWGTDPMPFTVTSNPPTVYGWAAYDPDTLRLIIVERFDAPRSPGIGDTLAVLPRVTLTTFVPCP